MKNANFYRTKFSGFHDLVKFRVREILLVSSSYDAFVLEEDGRLSEKIFNEYLDMNLQFVPRIRRVFSAEEAFSAMKERTYDLIITMARISDMNPQEFGRLIKEAYPGKPVVLLTYETLNSDFNEAKSRHTIGNGIFQEIYDIIFVDPDLFDLSKTNIIAQEIGELNQLLLNEGRKFQNLWLNTVQQEIRPTNLE